MKDKFNDIFLRSKTVTEKAERGYKVYTDNIKFQIIEAATVSEAMEKSGIKNPYKIEVAGLVKKTLFTKGEISEKQAPPPASAAAVTIESSPAEIQNPQNPAQ